MEEPEEEEKEEEKEEGEGRKSQHLPVYIHSWLTFFPRRPLTYPLRRISDCFSFPPSLHFIILRSRVAARSSAKVEIQIFLFPEIGI